MVFLSYQLSEIIAKWCDGISKILAQILWWDDRISGLLTLRNNGGMMVFLSYQPSEIMAG